jgi:hypothetical protein
VTTLRIRTSAAAKAMSHVVYRALSGGKRGKLAGERVPALRRRRTASRTRRGGRRRDGGRERGEKKEEE